MSHKNLEQRREYDRKYQYDRYYKIKNETFDKLGGKCIQCGSTENLEIDHIDSSTKSISSAHFWSVSKSKRDEELKKCQALCSICHKIKSDKEMTTRTHGTQSMYKRGKCRCIYCVEAYRAAHRKYNRKYKLKIKNKHMAL